MAARSISRRTIRAIRAASPGTTVEVLTPDFLRKDGALDVVMDARPDVFNHNLETVPRLYLSVRPGARYFASLRLLERAKELVPTGFTKSGLMVGLGESREEIMQVMDDLRAAECRFPHHRPISPADEKARRSCALLDAGGIQGARTGRARQGLPDGVGLAADAVVLSCRQRLRGAESRARLT